MDIWSHYTPYPFNQIPRSYSFMVAHPALWKFNYYLQQPRWVHVPTQRMWAPFVSRQACRPFHHGFPGLGAYAETDSVPLWRVAAVQEHMLFALLRKLVLIMSQGQAVSGSRNLHFGPRSSSLLRMRMCEGM